MNRYILISSFCVSLSGVASAVVVQFDFNDGAGSPTQAGWVDAPLGNGSGSGVTLVTSNVGVPTVDSRNRAGTANDAGGGTEAAMWNDFVFSNGSLANAPGSGLQLSLTGLSADTVYPITIWGFDDASNDQADGNGRSADWSGGGGSGTLTFSDGPDPATLADYNVTFNALTDGSGSLTLTGIVAATDPSTSHNVFINGLEVGDAIPEPSSVLLSLVALGGASLRRRR